MSRQFDDSMRRFNEFKDRFGEDDPLVSQWRTELDMRRAFESQYPARLAPSQGEGLAAGDATRVGKL